MVNRQTIVGGFVLGGIVLALAVLVLFSRLRSVRADHPGGAGVRGLRQTA